MWATASPLDVGTDVVHTTIFPEHLAIVREKLLGLDPHTIEHRPEIHRDDPVVFPKSCLRVTSCLHPRRRTRRRDRVLEDRERKEKRWRQIGKANGEGGSPPSRNSISELACAFLRWMDLMLVHFWLLTLVSLLAAASFAGRCIKQSGERLAQNRNRIEEDIS